MNDIHNRIPVYVFDAPGRNSVFVTTASPSVFFEQGRVVMSIYSAGPDCKSFRFCDRDIEAESVL